MHQIQLFYWNFHSLLIFQIFCIRMSITCNCGVVKVTCNYRKRCHKLSVNRAISSFVGIGKIVQHILMFTVCIVFMHPPINWEQVFYFMWKKPLTCDKVMLCWWSFYQKCRQDSNNSSSGKWWGVYIHTHVTNVTQHQIPH